MLSCHVILDDSVSRVTGSLIRTFPFPSHVTLTVLVCVMATHLDSSLSRLRFLAYASYSSPVVSIRLLSVPSSSYAQSSTRRFISYSLTRLDDIPVLYFYGSTPLCTCISPDLYIYWVGDGTIPIFNLLCNHPSVVT